MLVRTLRPAQPRRKFDHKAVELLCLDSSMQALYEVNYLWSWAATLSWGGCKIVHHHSVLVHFHLDRVWFSIISYWVEFYWSLLKPFHSVFVIFLTCATIIPLVWINKPRIRGDFDSSTAKEGSNWAYKQQSSFHACDMHTKIPTPKSRSYMIQSEVTNGKICDMICQSQSLAKIQSALLNLLATSNVRLGCWTSTSTASLWPKGSVSFFWDQRRAVICAAQPQSSSNQLVPSYSHNQSIWIDVLRCNGEICTAPWKKPQLGRASRG